MVDFPPANVAEPSLKICDLVTFASLPSKLFLEQLWDIGLNSINDNSFANVAAQAKQVLTTESPFDQ